MSNDSAVGESTETSTVPSTPDRTTTLPAVTWMSRSIRCVTANVSFRLIDFDSQIKALVVGLLRAAPALIRSPSQRVDHPRVDRVAGGLGGVLDQLLEGGRQAQGDSRVQVFCRAWTLARARWVADSQCRLTIAQHDIDGLFDKLGAHLGGGLLGDLHRCNLQRRSERFDQLGDCCLDGGIVARESGLIDQRRLHDVDDRTDLHGQSCHFRRRGLLERQSVAILYVTRQRWSRWSARSSSGSTGVMARSSAELFYDR